MACLVDDEVRPAQAHVNVANGTVARDVRATGLEPAGDAVVAEAVGAPQPVGDRVVVVAAERHAVRPLAPTGLPAPRKKKIIIKKKKKGKKGLERRNGERKGDEDKKATPKRKNSKMYSLSLFFLFFSPLVVNRSTDLRNGHGARRAAGARGHLTVRIPW